LRTIVAKPNPVFVSDKKPPLARDLIWRLQALGYDVTSAAVRLFPVEWVSALGGWLFCWLGPLTPSARIAERNIDLAFPGLDPAARAKLLRDQWDNLGRTFFEFPMTDQLVPAKGRVEVVGRDRLVAIAKSGKPAILISGHFANWEVMAAAIADAEVPARVTYRAANNPYIDKRIIDARARYGVRMFAPKGGGGSRELIETLKKGESVTFLNDQKFNQGVAAPFFGRIVHTAGASTRIALRFGAVMQPMSVQRLPGARFRVVVAEPIVLEHTGDREKDVEAGVRQINAFVEARVRERPAEWFWVHKRWPREEYQKR
jgi:KDO2-lipid IV(A) lauroyltransferase